MSSLGCSCDPSVGFTCPECHAEIEVTALIDRVLKLEQAFTVFICRKCGGDKQNIENRDGELYCKECGEELEPDMTPEFIEISREVIND